MDLVSTHLGRFSGVANGELRRGLPGQHTATLRVAGAGAVSCTVVIRGGNSEAALVTVASITATGTDSAVGTGSWGDDYRFWRADVTAISGANAAVQVDCASDVGAGFDLKSRAAQDAVRAITSDIDRLAAFYRGRTPGRLCAVGTSWTDGTGASTIDKSFRKLLETRYAGRMVPKNCARGGSNTEYHVTDAATDVNAESPLGPGDIIYYEAGFNDYSTGDGSPKHINYWKKVFLATLAWWCVPQRVDSLCSRLSLYNHTNPSAKTLTTSPRVTTTGSWTVGFGSGSGNRRMCLNGTTATFVGEGDMIYLIRWRGAGATANIQTVTIDGVVMDVDNARGTFATTSFVPHLERYPVPPGQHTVTVTGAVFPSEVMIFYRGKVPAQTVLVQPCHDVRLDARVDNSNTTSTSLSLTAPNAWWWDEGLQDRYKRTVRECVEVMKYDGWEIGIVENGNWDPMIHTADAGAGASATYHPNDRGHYQLFLPFADAIDRILGTK